MTDAGPSTSIHCRACGYDLSAVSENRCPECGRPFVPANPRTYDRYPHRWRSRRRERAILKLLLVLACLMAVFEVCLLVFYRPGWQREQAAIAALRQADASVGTCRIGPGFGLAGQAGGLLETIPGPFNYMLERATIVQVLSQPVPDEALAGLRSLQHLEQVILHQKQIGDEQVAYLKDLPNLKVLDLYGTPVSDAGLAHLEGLTQLVSLQLGDCRNITSEGLRHLAGMTQLRAMGLGGKIDDAGLAYLKDMTQMELLAITCDPGAASRVTDAGLAHLQNMRKLRHLTLYSRGISDAGLAQLVGFTGLGSLQIGAPVTDAGIAQLANLKNLRHLTLTSTLVTPQGIQRLQKAMPQTQIEGH